ncbi:MAG: histidinol dehydrogenase [Spirochaetaceae bacterium]|nr:MAG: histidinol dehydrogenase [Spirochaetaceae bacterium]
MNVSIYQWSELSDQQRQTLLRRSETDINTVLPTVERIMEDVRARGDAALRDYALQFDHADLSSLPLTVSSAEFDRAEARLSAPVKRALEFSIENVRRYHQAQLSHSMPMQQIRGGVWAGERTTAVASAGLYVPRGRGSFPSMLYMLAVPAVLAGVETLVIATPPGPDGSVDDACLYAARLCGVERIVRCGGSQAIAALAWGTESVPAVVKIVGPGSVYVAAAKRVVAGLVDTGVPAGPSESIILADKYADPWKVSLDLLVEAEHGSDSSALLVTPSRALAEAVAAIVPELIAETPDSPDPRRTFLSDVFANYGGIIIADDLQHAAGIVNQFATEHLQIQTNEPYDTLGMIQNAAEILLGEHSVFSLANYAAGANAILPTGGNAACWSPVSVHDFQKRSSVVHITAQGYRQMRDHVIALADYEGFHSHAQALRRRDESLS